MKFTKLLILLRKFEAIAIRYCAANNTFDMDMHRNVIHDQIKKNFVAAINREGLHECHNNQVSGHHNY